jgi:hypothetical protein
MGSMDNRCESRLKIAFAVKGFFNAKDAKGKPYLRPPGTLHEAGYDRHQFRQLDRLRHMHLVTET